MRYGKSARATKEVTVEAEVLLDGDGKFEGSTGLKFLDHLIRTLCFFSGMNFKIESKGDLVHHVVEDAALTLGDAFLRALGSGEGIARFGFACVPMDESLSLAVVDLSGRPYARVDLKEKALMVEDTPTEDIKHFLRSFSSSSKMTMHVSVLYGENDHHKVESSFKALAISIKQAIRLSSRGVPSSKGVLQP